MHIVFVENNNKFSDFLSRAVSSDIVSCFNIYDYGTLNHYLTSQEYPTPDVIVLDQDFKEQVITKSLPFIKKQCPNVKVLVLAEVPGAKERIRILELGADDCMTKPIDIEELLLRVKLLYGRTQVHRQVFLPENIRLNDSAKVLEIDGQRVNLNHKEYLLAETFLNHPQKVFSRVILFDLVWGIQSEVESNVVETTISNLRKKLKSSGALVEIKSRRNVGYWLESI